MIAITRVLARQFRAMAGFDKDEIDAIADDSRQVKEETRRRREATVAASSPEGS